MQRSQPTTPAPIPPTPTWRRPIKPSNNNSSNHLRHPYPLATPARALPARQQNESQQSAEQYPQPDSQATAPAEQTQSYSNQDSTYDPAYENQVDAGQQALEADAPPPPLHFYQQPDAPAPNYIWTPGYWSYAPVGYYWVPGAWVLAPYSGALWTPGYWGFVGGLYRFHHGFWGPHIGFYGGVNYGFGYTGSGYHGGYWNGNNFYYNRSVNRVNVTRITNVYNRTVIVNNNYNNVSYNGGRGGIPVRPQPAEIAALRGPRTPPMTAQVQNQRQAAQNREQFYNQNKGRPAIVAATRPLPADHGVTPAARPAPVNLTRPTPNNPQLQPNRPGQPQVKPPIQPARPAQPQVQPSRPGQAKVEPVHPEQPSVRPAEPQVHPANPTPPQQPRPAQPQPQPQTKPTPQAQSQIRPAPQPQPHPAQQLQPQVRPAPQPQPQAQSSNPPCAANPVPGPPPLRRSRNPSPTLYRNRNPSPTLYRNRNPGRFSLNHQPSRCKDLSHPSGPRHTKLPRPTRNPNLNPNRDPPPRENRRKLPMMRSITPTKRSTGCGCPILRAFAKGGVSCAARPLSLLNTAL